MPEHKTGSRQLPRRPRDLPAVRKPAADKDHRTTRFNARPARELEQRIIGLRN